MKTTALLEIRQSERTQFFRQVSNNEQMAVNEIHVFPQFVTRPFLPKGMIILCYVEIKTKKILKINIFLPFHALQVYYHIWYFYLPFLSKITIIFLFVARSIWNFGFLLNLGNVIEWPQNKATSCAPRCHFSGFSGFLRFYGILSRIFRIV